MRIYKGHEIDIMLNDSSLVSGFDMDVIHKVYHRLKTYYPQLAKKFSLAEIAVQQEIIDIHSLELLIMLHYIDRLELSGRYGVYGLQNPFAIYFIMKRIDIPKNILNVRLPPVSALPNEIAVVYYVYQVFLCCLKAITKIWDLESEVRAQFLEKRYIHRAQQSVVKYFFAEKIRLVSELNFLKGKYCQVENDMKAYQLQWVLMNLKEEIQESRVDLHGYRYEDVLCDIFTATFQIIEDFTTNYERKPYSHDTLEKDSAMLQHTEKLTQWLKSVLDVYFTDFLAEHMRKIFPHFFEEFTMEPIVEIDKDRLNAHQFIKFINPIGWFGHALIPKIRKEELHMESDPLDEVEQSTQSHHSHYTVGDESMHLFPTLINPMFRENIHKNVIEISSLLHQIEVEEQLKQEQLTPRPPRLFWTELESSSQSQAPAQPQPQPSQAKPEHIATTQDEEREKTCQVQSTPVPVMQNQPEELPSSPFNQTVNKVFSIFR